MDPPPLFCTMMSTSVPICALIIWFALCRYELCFTGEKILKAASASQGHEPDTEKSQNHVPAVNGERSAAEGDNVVDMFRWSRCKKPLPQKVMRSIGIPLPLEHVEVLLSDFCLGYVHVTS